MEHETLACCPKCGNTKNLICYLIVGGMYKCQCGTRWTWEWAETADGRIVKGSYGELALQLRESSSISE